jgi:cobalt/nickel transport system permease protein
MVNFPVGGGTSGHLIGGALCAILVGPWAAILAMSVVVITQALVFGDGGITAIGLNGMNMAIIAPLTGWGVYSLVKQLALGNDRVRKGIAIGCASWASVLVAASACAAELSVSDAISGGSYGVAAPVAFPSMLGWHAVIGIGEAIIACAVISYVHQVSPRLFRGSAADEIAVKVLGHSVPRIVVASVSVLMVFALALPLFFLYAYESPDGLERTMTDAGVSEPAPILSGALDYGDTYLAAIIAGVVGFLVIVLLLLGLSRLVAKIRGEEK